MDRVKVFQSDTEDYHYAFQTFLDHTDQKHMANEWLEDFITRLPQKNLFVDAGAGNGKLTAWLLGYFNRTIALEPNPSLCRELSKHCLKAEVQQATILNGKVEPEAADFILASHVFYYIPREEWLPDVSRLASWLSAQGSLVVILQNSHTDCMNMLRHFHKKSFNLHELGDEFKTMQYARYHVNMDTVQSHIETPDFKTAYTVAEFMLNLLPMSEPPARAELEEYVERHFSIGGGRYRFSCHQDFLRIWRRA